MDSDSVGFIILIVGLVFGVFFSAGAEALEEISESKMRRRATEGDKKATTLLLCSRHEGFFAPLVPSSMFMALLGTVAATDLLLTHISDVTMQLILDSSVRPSIWTTAAVRYGVLLLFALLSGGVILILTQAVPRRIVRRDPEKFAYNMCGVLSFFVAIERPFVAVMSGITKGILSIIGMNVQEDDDQVTEEEIRELVEEGNQSGTIHKTEREMINNVFDFADRTVVEVMTHRTDLLAVSTQADLQSLVELAKTSGHSRIPVYQDTVDNIHGILYVKDLLALLGDSNPTQGFDIAGIMRKPMFVPESTHCHDLFGQFRAKKLHMAVVVDEYGGTSGLVTMEDLVESVLGNIQDEYDNEEDSSMRITDDLFTLDGAMSIDDTERLLDIEITDDTDYETIGGLLVELLDHIPGPGEHPHVDLSGFRFTVTQADQRRIMSITAQRLKNLSIQND